MMTTKKITTETINRLNNALKGLEQYHVHMQVKLRGNNQSILSLKTDFVEFENDQKLDISTYLKLKSDKEDSNKVIEGATFKIEKLDTEGNVDNSFEAKELTTGENGKVKFEGLDNINDVQTFRDCYLSVTEEQQSDLEDGEYYYHQIIGLDVVTDDGRELGKIKEIMSPGANDVWVVERSGKQDLLLPVIKDVIKDVDLDKHLVTVELMEGLE